ncbi:hypothetical protein [Cognatishimia sp. F0-27]|uniref:hypothetical protein n=1 Tax=Cognatishimia sp. F0-27 TaxID=2816855 RepID=UPI001D0C36F7|nr:hypothetical protein [Cognatishimia sp. F0-27]MCC1492230.1 hypothetical protein [Cognatishimia sp. F0-27]
MLRFLLLLAALAALAGFATRPGVDDAETAMREQVLLAVANQELRGKSTAEQAALLACRLDPTSCYDLIRSGIDITFEARLVYARVDLEGFGKSATCYGLFTRFFCPGGLRDA